MIPHGPTTNEFLRAFASSPSPTRPLSQNERVDLVLVDKLLYMYDTEKTDAVEAMISVGVSTKNNSESVSLVS